MVTTKLNIGKIPISKGEYQEGTTYQRLNQVTMLGSTYQSKIDDNTSAPAQMGAGGAVENINTDKWLCIAVGNVSAARKVVYNNETSGLEAGNVQEAIDEVGSKVSDLQYIIEDAIIELSFTKAYQYISVGKISAGRKVTNRSSFTIYLCKEVNDYTDAITLKAGETIFVDKDISAIRCGNTFTTGSLFVYKDYTRLESFSKMEENYNEIVGYTIECEGEASSINSITLIPKGSKVANVGDIPFSLHGKDYVNERVSLIANTPVYLDFDAVKLTIGSNAGGIAKLKVFSKYIETAIYEENAKNTEYNSTKTVLSFKVNSAYEYFNLEAPIPVGVKVSNEGDIPFYLYSDGEDRMTLRVNEHLFTNMEISRIRAASYLGTINLRVFSKDMTMNDSLSILKSQFDNCILNIAYSQLNDDIAPINTETHFDYAISKGFNVLKADMRLTKDNKIVLCHDAGFTLNEDGRIIGYNEDNNILIRNLDRDAIINLEHSYFYDSLGKYEHPMTLEKFLVICKINNVIPYITFRSEYIEETLNALTPILEKFNYTHKCIINVNPQNIDTCYQIRKYLPFISICHTLNSTELITKDIINQVYRIGNGCLCANTNALDKIDKEIFDFSRNKEIRLLGWFISDKESYKKYVNNGFCGFQITSSEVIEKEL